MATQHVKATSPGRFVVATNHPHPLHLKGLQQQRFVSHVLYVESVHILHARVQAEGTVPARNTLFLWQHSTALQTPPGTGICHMPLAPVSRWPRPAALRQGCRRFLHEPLPSHKVTLGMSCSHMGRGHNSWEQNHHLLCLPINTHTQTHTRPLHRASHFAKPFHSHNPIWWSQWLKGEGWPGRGEPTVSSSHCPTLDLTRFPQTLLT